jgi:hypothetical protein
MAIAFFTHHPITNRLGGIEMTNRIADISLSKTARVAGFTLLLSFVAGIFAFETFMVPGI